MILAIPESNTNPANPAQWDRYYNTADDKVYIQTLPVGPPPYPTWVEMAKGPAIREDMRHIDTLVRTKYSAKDYQTYLDQILAYIAEKWGDQFNDWMASDPAIMLTEYVSAALDQMSWYLDKESDEFYLELARVRSNAAMLARYLGYKSTPAVSATVDETFTLSQTYTFDVPIRKGHQVEGPNGLIFEVGQDEIIPAGYGPANPIEFNVYQGQTFVESFVSDGTANQVFKLSLIPSGKFLAKEKNLCKVGGDTWTEYEFLPYENADAYEVAYLNSPPTLRFGDGVVGKIPPLGEEVRISYIATGGKDGMLASSNTVTKNLTPVVVNFQQIPISVTNAKNASGGAPAETIESIKANAPRSFMAADRLVTKGDYDALAGHFSDPIYGSIAKADARTIRGVEGDLELQALMDALVADADSLGGDLGDITDLQEAIKGYTGKVTTVDTIRYLLNSIGTKNTSIRSKTDDIDTQVTTVQKNISDAQSDIELAQLKLDYLSFQEAVGYGDGTKGKIADPFTKKLAKYPIKKGSVAVFVANTAFDKEADPADGDCDTEPGILSSANMDPDFDVNDIGKMIRIGGEYRQILKVVTGDKIEYTGPRIYGTGLIVEVYPLSVVGYDNGANVISGTGIAAGSINYTDGNISIAFTVAPDGLSGKYGVPIICTYQYKEEGIKTTLTAANDDCVLAGTNTSTFSTYGTDMDGFADESDTDCTGIETKCDSIDADADSTNAKVASLNGTIVQIGTDTDSLEAYIGTMFSGECKANVIRVSCLAVDANGFYEAPTNSLMGALKAYLTARREETVRISVVSGAFYLLKVSLEVELKIKEQYLFQDISPLAVSAFDTLLKGREYKQALLRGEYYDAADDIEGVEYANVRISSLAWDDGNNEGTLPTVDSNGNLFIDDHDIITKGTVLVTEII